MSHPMCYTVRITIKENMRTTYRGQNRAQAMKQYRDYLEYQKLKAEKKQSKLMSLFARPFLSFLKPNNKKGS